MLTARIHLDGAPEHDLALVDGLSAIEAGALAGLASQKPTQTA